MVLPITYAFDALERVSRSSTWSRELTVDLVVVAASIAASLMLAATTLRRRTP